MSAPGRTQGFDALSVFKDVVNTHHEIMGYPPAFPSEPARVAVIALHDPPCRQCGGQLLRGNNTARCATCGTHVEVSP